MNFNAAMQEEKEDMAEVQLEDENPETVSLVKLDAPSVVAKISRFGEEIARWERQAGDTQVVSAATQVDAATLGGAAAKLRKAIEARRKEEIRDAEDFVKSVNGFCKGYSERLKAIEDDLKGKLTQYQAKVELERRRQAEAAEKARREFQEKIDAEAAEANRKAREEARMKAEAEQAEARRLAEAEAEKRKASEAEIAEIRRKAEADRMAALKLADEEAKAREIQAPQVPEMVVREEKGTVRTSTGVSSYGSKRWTADIEDPEQVPHEYCSPDQKKINEAVRAGVRVIPGVKIYEKDSTRFRT